jgi:uncharacterized protein YhaN
MNEKKKNRRELRNRLQRAQEAIYKKKGYRPALAQKMAREFCDMVCKKVDHAR